MAAKEADAKGAGDVAALLPVAAVDAQPDSSEPTENAPSGSMGAAAIIFRAERRDDGFEWDMIEFNGG